MPRRRLTDGGRGSAHRRSGGLGLGRWPTPPCCTEARGSSRRREGSIHVIHIVNEESVDLASQWGRERSTHPADELISPLEPRSELFVGSSVVFDFRDSVEESIKGTATGKALEEDAEFLSCLLYDRVIAEYALDDTSLLLAGRLGGTEVRLERVEEPGDCALVRRV